MGTPENKARRRGESRAGGISLRAMSRYWITCATGAGKSRRVRAMVKALQRWLDAHQLPAIIAAVLGVIMTISVLMVVGGYLVARP
jgi:hypothetical protein